VNIAGRCTGASVVRRHRSGGLWKQAWTAVTSEHWSLESDVQIICVLICH